MTTDAPAPAPGMDLDGRRLLLNPGSVGQPRDGDPRASYLVLDLVARRASWGRVAYDIDAVRDRMRALGLPARLSERLRHGY
jgi:diadenosine tetraphosphatase ApaH/serine/threonine PP2A family protein phosphatase